MWSLWSSGLHLLPAFHSGGLPFPPPSDKSPLCQPHALPPWILLVSKTHQLPLLCCIPTESHRIATCTLVTKCSADVKGGTLTQRAEGSRHTLPYVLEEIHTGIFRWTRGFGFKKQRYF